jgi:membrane protein DedA with SNARE-associated domain
MLVNLDAWIELLGGFYNRYGYVVVFLGALFENTALLGLVFPGGTLALLGAFYARQGTLSLSWVIALATLGTILGYHVDYLLGRFVLAHAMSRWGTSRLGRRLRLAGRLRLARKLLSKHGGKAILLSHTIGHIRSFIALSAGITHMRYPRFLAFEIVAALLWNIVFCLVGYFVAIEIDQLQRLFERAGWIILGIFIVLFFAWSWWRRRRRHHARHIRRSKISSTARTH